MPILLLALLTGCAAETPSPKPVVIDAQPYIDHSPLGGFTGSAQEAIYIIPGDTASAIFGLREIVVYNLSPKTSFSVEDSLNIVIFRGVYNTGGYSIDISKVLLDGNTFRVHAVYVDPGPGLITTQAFTHPTAVIPIGKLTKGSYEVRLLVVQEVITGAGTVIRKEEAERGRIAFTVEGG
jgi:hypothetical protein